MILTIAGPPHGQSLAQSAKDFPPSLLVEFLKTTDEFCILYLADDVS